MSELYLCVHVTEFPAQALVRLRPDLSQSPVVVLQGEAPLEQVCSVNSRALRLGVRRMMMRRELDSFSGLVLLRRSVQEERNASEALLEAAGMFTPRIEVWPAEGSGWLMVLDMSGTERMSGPVELSARRIQESMKRLCFSVRVAVSSNFSTAVCLAVSAQKFLVIVPRGAEAQHLAPLPLATLGLTIQQAEAFELWGLRTVGDLARLPEKDLIGRLGQAGKRLMQRARGESAHLMVPKEPRFALAEVLELDSPVEVLESLLFILSPMLGQVLTRAQNHAFALASVTVRLVLDGGGEHERTIKPALPVAELKLILKLLHLDLQAHPPAAGVMGVFLSAEPGERSKVQLGLWSPQLPEPMRLDVMLAKIAALVGEERVGCAVLNDTHRPESFRMKRFAVSQGVFCKAKRAPDSCVALRRCRPPILLSVCNDAGVPSTLHLRGAIYKIERAYGPWRKSGDWWCAEVWSCDEWDVQATGKDDTILCLISHDLLREQWQLEAFYD